jgi:dihydroxyacetone kinase-like predicted kinase
LRIWKTVLKNTPELLPVLKEAGVVDSGGQGLLEIVKGAYDALLGKEISFTNLSVNEVSGGTTREKISTDDIKFGYCTEFIIMLEKEYNTNTENEFKGYLESIGDSIVVVSDDDVVKVHVHTNDPGLAIQKALTYGSLTRMKIDNMREEHNED